MLIFLLSFVPIAAWGSWVAVSQNVKSPNNQVKTFYITLANLLLSFIVYKITGEKINFNWFWLPFLGGIIWSVSGFLALTGTENIGIAKACGIWSPVNIIMGMIWGAVLYKEFSQTSLFNLIMIGLALLIILAGIFLIVTAKNSSGETSGKKNEMLGLLGSFGAGILWGTYFIPIKMAQMTLWAAVLPMAIGMFAGSILLMLLAGKAPKLEKKSDYIKVSLSGIIWGIGNYGMLVLTDQIGTGRGYTIAQLSLIVNAVIGIYLFRDPPANTKAGKITLAGILLAMIGGIMTGYFK